MSEPTDTSVEAGEEEKKFDFDEGFQQKLTSLILRDPDFNARVEGLVQPSYFTSTAHGIVARLATDYYNKYRFCPSPKLVPTLIREAMDKKLIRKDDLKDVVECVRACLADDLSGAEYVTDNVNLFARRMAMEEAIYKAAEMIDSGKIDSVEEVIKAALNVGLNEETNRYDFWGNNDSRAEYRTEVAAGRIKPTGITTGFRELDGRLYHQGWGRKELSCLMGPAKSGKSMALMGFALSAALAGYNVCYVTLEVAARIIADRMDANIGNTAMGNLPSAIGLVRGRVAAKAAAAGALDLFDFPSGTMSPSDLRRLITKRRSVGVPYDLVVVDYADLMRPTELSREPRENSRLIYIGLRAIAQEFDLAMLTATQTNREGFKAEMARMENVADDINKARTVDLLISLNASDDERARGESRLYFAASRNQKSDLSIRVKTDLGKAKYIASVMGVE